MSAWQRSGSAKPRDNGGRRAGGRGGATDSRVTTRLSGAAGLLAALGGIIVLGGWSAGVPLLQAPVAGAASMKVNTALCFVLAGLSLVAPGGAARFAAAGVLMLAGLTLLQHAFDLDLGIDQILFDDPYALHGAAPGRMSVISGTAFLLFGAARLVAPARSPAVERLFVAVTAIGLLVGYVVLLGLAYGAVPLYRPGPGWSVALHTAVGFVVLFGGLAARRPDLGLAVLLRSRGAGGQLARRLLPVIALLLPLLGWLRLQGELAGLYDTRLGLALMVASSVVVLTLVVWIGARQVDRIDASRESLHSSLAATDARLGASERRYRHAMELIPALVLVCEGDRVVLANPEAVRVLGVSGPEALVGRRLGDLLHAEDGARVVERLRLAAARGRALPPTETRFRDGAGDAVLVDLRSSAPFLDEGRRLVVLSGIDVTAQRATEERLRQAQKFDALGQLTGGIAHDFNNLLTVIIGSLGAASRRVEGEVKPLVQGALDAAERGEGLVRRLLGFARRQPVRSAPFDVNQAIGEMQELLRRSLGAGIAIDMSLAADLWTVLADRSQFENAILNLVINARDAMPGGGRVSIETANARLDEDYAVRNSDVLPGDYVMIAVSDTGTGMSPAVQARAFDPFFTTKTEGQGTGLGLSMVYGFTRQSRGHARLYSEPGLGTTVRLYLPRTSGQAPGAARAVAADPPVERGSETILVVEDDPDVRRLAVRQLGELGYQVIEAADALEARAILDGPRPIDLVFSDVVMPGGVTAREVLAEAMARRPGLKVLFTSGYAQDAVVHQGRLDAGVAFLSKPYRARDLAAKMREMLSENV